MSVREAFDSLKNSSRTARLLLAVTVTAGVGSLAVACSAGDSEAESYVYEVRSGQIDRPSMRSFLK